MGRRKFPFVRWATVVSLASLIAVAPGTARADEVPILPAPAAAASRVLQPAPGGYVPITPFRVMDTREAANVPARRYSGAPYVSPWQTRLVQVTNPNDTTLPTGGAAAANITVTVSDAWSGGFLAIWPADQPWSGTSNVNFNAGRAMSNAVTMRLSASGAVNVMASTGINLIIDVNGWHTDQPASGPVAGGGFVGIAPQRLLDTRAPGQTKPGDGSTRILRVPRPPSLDTAGIGALVLNVTITAPTSNGWAAVLPYDVPPAPASNLNYAEGQTIANQVIVRPGAPDHFYVYVASSAHIIVDLMGFFTAGPVRPGGFVPLRPARVMDSRYGFGNYAYVAPQEAHLLVLGGTMGVPNGAGAVAVNLIAIAPSSSGYITAWPDSQPRPLSAALNVGAGETTAGLATVGLGPSGGAMFFGSSKPALVVDLFGWYASPYVTVNN